MHVAAAAFWQWHGNRGARDDEEESSAPWTELGGSSWSPDRCPVERRAAVRTLNPYNLDFSPHLWTSVPINSAKHQPKMDFKCLLNGP